jgi:hypothetical protein
MQSIGKQVVLPYCCAVLEPDVVPLHHRYCCPKDWEWWVSIWTLIWSPTLSSGWKSLGFCSVSNSFYLERFLVLFSLGMWMVFCWKGNLSLELVCQKGLCALLYCISDIVWDQRCRIYPRARPVGRGSFLFLRKFSLLLVEGTFPVANSGGNFPSVGEIFYFSGRFCTSVWDFQSDGVCHRSTNCT